MSKAKTRRMKRWDSPVEGYLFLLPWLIGIVVLTAYPMGLSIYYSMTNFNLLEPASWIGFNNYKKIFTEDETFRISLSVTLRFVFIAVPLKLIFALFVAMILNQKLRGISLYRTMIYFPSLIGSSIAISILWKNIFGSEGFINQLLELFDITGKSWINSPGSALNTLIVLVVWQFGSSMVIFLAGLKQIPKDMYEASSVDGAGPIYKFFRITLPLLSPIILFNLIMQTITAFQMFTQAMIITNGGPVNSTYVYVLYLYQQGFTRFQMGYASALAWVLLIIIALVSLLIFISSRYWVFYESGGKAHGKS